MSYLLYLFIGAIVGTLSGLFGIGGGVVIVPLLSLLFKKAGFSPDIVMFMAIGTSLATIVITVSSSTYRHFQLGNLLKDVSLKLVPPTIVGVIIGGLLTRYLEARTLEIAFIVYLYLVSIKMLLYKVRTEEPKKTSRLMYNIVGIIIGFKSSVLGIGGGTISIPFLAWRGYKMKNAVAVSASLGIPVSVFGSIFYIINGFGKDLPEHSFGYIYLPAFIGISLTSVFFTKLGAKISAVANQELLKKFFAVFLLFLATKKLFDFF